MITLTELAAKQIQQALAARGHGIGMRVSIQVTGCSGMAYVLDYADDICEQDIEIKDREVILLIDAKDQEYFSGMQIDYVNKGLQFIGFEFTNPNEKARCGCGKSFTV